LRLSSKRWSFQPGQVAYIRLVFSNAVPLNNAYAFFVHEEDSDSHLMFGFKSAEGKALQPSIENHIDLEEYIPGDMKPGVYSLDKINFETASGHTVDAKMEADQASFEVVPAQEHAPVVKGGVGRTTERLQDSYGAGIG
jgi:hypothetical protein